MLGANSVVTNFYLHDRLLCHLGHLCIPSSEQVKLIWEAHYSRVAVHFDVEKTMEVLQKHFYGRNFNKMWESISILSLPALFPK
jgi:hypothetical protein